MFHKVMEKKSSKYGCCSCLDITSTHGPQVGTGKTKIWRIVKQDKGNTKKHNLSKFATTLQK